MDIRKIMTAVILAGTAAMEAAPLIKDGDKIAFVGDSITNFGNRPDGYIHLVMDGLKQAGIKNLAFIPAGVNGERTTQVLKRMPGILKQKPSWVVLKIGTNDVYWNPDHTGGVALPDYRKNIRQIIRMTRESGAQILLVTPSMRKEDPNSSWNKDLRGYCEFLRTEAAAQKIPLTDWNKTMQTLLASGKIPGDKGVCMTIDTVHLNGYGNIYLAETILGTMGIDQKRIAKLDAQWKKRPSMAPILNSWENPSFKISVEDHALLVKEAHKHKMTVDSYCRKLIYDKIEGLKKK